MKVSYDQNRHSVVVNGDSKALAAARTSCKQNDVRDGMDSGGRRHIPGSRTSGQPLCQCVML